MAEEETEKETIYDEEGRENMGDSDEITPEEEGFMKGYESADERKEDKEEKEDKEDKEEEEEKEEE